MTKRPGSVLFMCNMNSIRSPMAAAMVRHMYGTSIYVRSVGVEGGKTDGFMVTVMTEIGIDVSSHAAKQFFDLGDSNFDVLIALSAKANRYAEELSLTRAIDIEFWPLQDPSLAIGNRDVRLETYRDVRNSIIRLIIDRFGPPDRALFDPVAEANYSEKRGK